MAFAKTPYPHWAGSYVPLVGMGNQFFVSSTASGASDGNLGDSPERPLATLDAAFARCTANNGDVIHVMANHSETITGAAGIAHDVAGVSVIGYGHGGQRPTFLMDAGTAVTYKITANDALLRNVILNAGHNGIITGIDVQTATDAWIDQVEFTDNATNEHFLTCIKSGTTGDNECDGLRITNCKWFSVDAGSLEFYEMLGDLDRLVMQGNDIQTLGTASPMLLCTAGDDIQNCVITGNRHISAMTANDLFVTNDQADNTGIIADNFVGHLDVAIAILITCDDVFMFENYSNSTNATSGAIEPAADSIT